MARLTPTEAAAKWQRNLSNSTEDIRAGIERVDVAPGAQAAKKRQKWEQGVRDSAAKWQRNVAAVPLDEWKRKAIEVGLPRVSSGAQANEGKTADFFGEFLPHLDRGVAKIDAMPDNTLDDRINRSVAMMRHNSEFERGAGSR